MGRKRRIDGAGAWHHVMHRGAGRRQVFRDDVDRQRFVDFLAELDQRFGVQIHSYCLVGNHFHLLVRSADARLSEAMQWLLANFTRWTNHRREVDGAIFRGRFHSVAVSDERHARWLVRYVHENARDVGWTGDLAAYPWSSLGALTRGSGPEWLYRDVVGWFGGASKLVDFISSDRRASGPLVSTDGDGGAAKVSDAQAAVEAVAGFVTDAVAADRNAAVVELVRRFVGDDISWLAHQRGLDTKTAAQRARRAIRRCHTSETCQRLIDLASPMLATGASNGV